MKRCSASKLGVSHWASGGCWLQSWLRKESLLFFSFSCHSCLLAISNVRRARSNGGMGGLDGLQLIRPNVMQAPQP